MDLVGQAGKGCGRVRFVCVLFVGGTLTGNSGGRCLRWINYFSQNWKGDTCAFQQCVCACVC